MSNPRGWRRTAAEYEKFSQTDTPNKTVARSSHDVGQVKKTPHQGQAPKQTHENLWFKKHEKNPVVAQREVYAQELFRMFIPNHPKTRLALDEQRNTYVLSQGVQGYRSLADLIHNQIDGTSMLNQCFQDAGDRPFGFNKINGLGDIVVMSLLMNEVDFKLGNMGIDQDMRMVKIDGDWCFAKLNNFQGKFDITSEMIDQLPYPGGYEAYNWLDSISEGRRNPNPVLLGAGKMQEFRQEVNAALLKAVLMPDLYLIVMANHHMKSRHADECYVEIAARRNQMRQAALANNSFRDFMLTPEAVQIKNEFMQNLDQFNMTGKVKLVANQNIAHHKINEAFNNIVNGIDQKINNIHSNDKVDVKNINQVSSNQVVDSIKALLKNHADFYHTKKLDNYFKVLNDETIDPDQKLARMSTIAKKENSAFSLSKESREVSDIHSLLKHADNPGKREQVINKIDIMNKLIDQSRQNRNALNEKIDTPQSRKNKF